MLNGSNPLISVIIPTRERCETLPFAIQTVLDQDFGEMELIVSDNLSQDETPEVVARFTDGRLRYVRTDQRLSMCDHWDFALSHARGDYVIIIGDDDGLMPGALAKLRGFIECLPSPIYQWQPHVYIWPFGDRDPVIDCVAKRVSPHGVNLRDRVRFVIRNGTWRYTTLPMVYHSAVKREILDEIRQLTGRVFHSTQPDIFMCFALPAMTDASFHTGEALSIGGQSPKSNSSLVVVKDLRAYEQFRQEYGDYRMHPDVVTSSSFPEYTSLIVDSAMIAMGLFADYYKDVRFGFSAMWAYTVRCSGWAGIGEVLRMRKRLRDRQGFGLAMFLSYCGVQAAANVRRRMMRRHFEPTRHLNRDLRRAGSATPRDVRGAAELIFAHGY